MRYKIFHSLTGRPLALCDDIAGAVDAMQYHTRMLAAQAQPSDFVPVAMILDIYSNRVL